MSKIRVVLTVSFLCLMPVLNVAAQKARAPVRDYFPLRVGDSWRYRSDEGEYEFTVKVLSEEKQPDGTIQYLVEKFIGVGVHTWYSKTRGWVLMHRDAYPTQEGLDVKYAPARQFLANPLVVGAKWTWRGKSVMGTDVVEINEIAGVEMVKIPAGTFRAMKIISKVTDGDVAMRKTYWYADGVGLIKSMSEAGATRYGWELVDYNFKKKSRGK
jgi:hypothetical protein